MTTITREWLLQAIADIESIRDEIPFGVDTDVAKTLEAYKIALASLNAENNTKPVAFINGAWTLVYYRPPKELGLNIGDKLYPSPPAPVVPDEIEPDDSNTFDYVDGWNACRATMLQGNKS